MRVLSHTVLNLCVSTRRKPCTSTHHMTMRVISYSHSYVVLILRVCKYSVVCTHSVCCTSIYGNYANEYLFRVPGVVTLWQPIPGWSPSGNHSWGGHTWDIPKHDAKSQNDSVRGLR